LGYLPFNTGDDIKISPPRHPAAIASAIIARILYLSHLNSLFYNIITAIMSYQQGHPQQHYAPPPGAPPAPQQHQQQYYPQQHPPPPQQQQQQQLQQHLAPQQQHVGQQHPSDNGQFPGGSYSVTHRDTNAVLNITLQQGANVRSKSGAMVHMSGNVQLTGKVKFSMKKLFTGGEMSESTYNGPGRVALAPTLFGDIITLHVDGRTPWVIGRDAFLACTSEVAKETKSQGISKALFSGEDLFVYNVVGQGIMWLTSFGAVDRVDVSLPNFAQSFPAFANLFI
jgi:hypothetical protein